VAGATSVNKRATGQFVRAGTKLGDGEEAEESRESDENKREDTNAAAKVRGKDARSDGKRKNRNDQPADQVA
jgi:hypothetical protein